MTVFYGMTIIEGMILFALLGVLCAAIWLEVDSKKADRERKRDREARERLYKSLRPFFFCLESYKVKKKEENRQALK